ncbi:MAG: tetratricopeptide (TPR) repeat protein [Saprospiraceae bacterium]|jgi:tetratricopeptide (TPR) repeat protein
MAKKQKKKHSTPVKKTSVLKIPVTPITLVEENIFLYDRIFKILSIVILVTTLLLALQSGVNGDDKFQNDYSEKLVNFYTSFGQDKAALNVPQGKMHYYGGFFDLTTGLVNRTLGFDQWDAGYHHVRHLFNAILGFLAMFFTALIARELAGRKAGILALLFLFLSPRFLGHSLMNPKDIPFAAGYIIAVYFLMQLLKNMPNPTRKNMLGFILGTALAIATRAGGLMIFGFLGLFFLMDYWDKRKIKTEQNLITSYLKNGLILVSTSYVLALLYWPFGLVNPIVHPMEALGEFSKLGVRIRVLFAGESIMTDSEPWYYIPMWMYRTIPLFVTIGFLGSFLFVKKYVLQHKSLPISLLYFVTLFPLAFIAAKESLLHDGWRHLIFVYPPMVVAAVLFWINLDKLTIGKKYLQYGLYAILGLLMLEPASYIVRNSAYPYTYFQPFVGGISGNYGHYETDYWGVSVKQAVKWLEDENIISENMRDTVTIASSFQYPADVYLKKYDKVKTKYTRFQGRYSKDWDYAIFPTRFINAGQLLKSFPPSKAVHTVEANGVPLSIIINDKDKYTYRAEKALQQRDTIYAIDQFQKELTTNADNEQAWLGMADAYYGSKNYEKVLYSAEQAMNIAPENVSAMYFKGLALAGMNRSNEARDIFEKAIATDSEFYIAYFYLGVIAMEAGDLKTALDYAKTTLEIKPSFRNGQLLVAEIYALAGQKEKGEEFLKKMERFKKK